MRTVAFHNLGCKVNSYETEVMMQKLVEAGYQLVDFDEKADIYVINTCTVTNVADRKSRQMLHKAKRKNPDAVVVAAGCYVQTGTEQLLKDSSVDLVIGNNKKKDFVELLEAYLEQRESSSGCAKPVDKTLSETTVIDINHAKEYEEMTLSSTFEHTRAYIKIQDGCNQFCSYCMIPFARGRVRSRAVADVVKEIRGLAKRGYQEVVITGIHLSSYGMDFEGTVRDENLFAPQELVKALQQINEIEGIERIRLGSLEPRIITGEFLNEMKKVTKLCPHFHLSLQSGCNKTLKDMNRHYTTEQFAEKVELLRKYYDHPAITTDVIVGFPGETDADFEQTYEFLKKIKFFEMHIFKYSVRKGTAAAKMKNQVPEEIKEIRSNRLLEMEKEQSMEFRSWYIGKEISILLEEEKEISGQMYWIGHTPEYVKAAVSSKENLGNQFMRCMPVDFLTEDILYVSTI